MFQFNCPIKYKYGLSFRFIYIIQYHFWLFTKKKQYNSQMEKRKNIPILDVYVHVVSWHTWITVVEITFQITHIATNIRITQPRMPVRSLKKAFSIQIVYQNLNANCSESLTDCSRLWTICGCQWQRQFKFWRQLLYECALVHIFIIYIWLLAACKLQTGITWQVHPTI